MIHCPSLPIPENGIKIRNETSCGVVEEFVCKSRYELVGPAERVCLTNGSWSDEQAICRGKYSSVCENIKLMVYAISC